VHFARESIWRKPLRDGVGIEKCAINSFRGCAQDSMEPDCVG
jgi:hypothetical protein